MGVGVLREVVIVTIRMLRWGVRLAVFPKNAPSKWWQVGKQQDFVHINPLKTVGEAHGDDDITLWTPCTYYELQLDRVLLQTPALTEVLQRANAESTELTTTP